MDDTTQILNSKITSYVVDCLVNRLREIWDNPHFILNVIVLLKTDSERQKLLDIIEKENLTDTDEIIYVALDIKDGYL